MRYRVFLLGVALGLGDIAIVSCGSGGSKKTPVPNGEAGAGGEAGDGRGGTGGAGQAGSPEPPAGGADAGPAGAAGAVSAAGAAGGAGQAGAAGATGQTGEAGASGAACDAPITGRITIAFDVVDPERITNLQWTSSSATLTANVTAAGGPQHCTDPQEFFGQSYGAPEGTLPDPVVGGHLATFLQCGADATVTSAAIGCEPAGAAQLPVTTRYQFYNDARASELRVTRTLGFDTSTPVYAGTTGIRAYVPRVSIALLPNVMHPNQAGTAVISGASSGCGGDCITPMGASWNGKWFADFNPASGLALIVLRDPALTSAVDLTVNTDSASGSNLTSFVLVQPVSGWTAPVTETEYLCFADLTTWPQAQRDSAQLPAGCGP